MILLTHGYFLEEDAREKEIMKPYPPLGILSISAYLDANGIENTVYDNTFSSFQDLKKELLAVKPPLMGIYTNLMTKLNVLKIIEFVHNELKGSKIILGGPEVRHYCKEYLESGADMIVIGEGEQTMLEICRYFRQHALLPENCEGTAFIKNGELLQNAERKLIRDIDQLPFPNREKIDLNLYLKAWKQRHGKSMISVNTMRGCPYTCKWCSRAVYGGTYRRRSPALVVSELQHLKRQYNPDGFWFVDDVFTISHKWLQEFAIIIEEKNVSVAYEIITRADRLTEEVILLLKQSGCFRIWIGAESGSQKVIDAMDRRVEVQKVREMIRLSKKHGIEAGTFIMLGYPGEKKKDIRETITHLKECNPDHYTITLAYPIKGTGLYEEVKNSITAFDFAITTDRDLDFKRTHSRAFYSYAVRWVHNEVKSATVKSLSDRVKFKIKSVFAQGLMFLHSG